MEEMQNEALNKLFHLFTHDLCVPLAVQLHVRTGKPIYAIYDSTARVMWWGIDYWHYFVKLDEDRFLSARGIHTEEETVAFWAKTHKDPAILEHACIAPHHPMLEELATCKSIVV